MDFIKSIVKLVAKFLLGVAFLLFIFLALPVLLYRQILAKSVPLFSKKLRKILPPQSQTYLSCRPHKALNILIWFKVSGKLNSDLVKERFQTNCIFVRNDSGDLVYPELQQYPTMFGGYAFWKWEESFDMDKHFHHVTLDQEADAHAQFQRMLQTPLPEKLSPWEATFLEFGDNSDCHFICFKFHHSLCDGEAIFGVLMRVADSEPQRIQFRQQRTSRLDFFRRILYFISSYFNLIFNSMDSTPMIFDSSSLTGVRYYPMSRSFDLGQVKQLRSKLSVSVSIVMIGLLTGAIRRKLQNEGKSIPQEMGCITAVFSPNHPKKLTNKVYTLDIPLPVGAASAHERLALLERYANAERRTKSAAVRFLLAAFIGSLPMRWMFPVVRLNTVVASAFPGPTKAFSIGGNVVKDMEYAINGCSYGLTATIASYNGTFRYCIGVDGKICPTEESAIEFVDYIAAELDETIRSTGVEYELVP